jgi:hypothetical protein
MSQPYQLTLLGLVLLIGWMLALTLLTLWLWFCLDGRKGKGDQTPEAPAKRPQRPPAALKPPPGSPRDPHAQPQEPTTALMGSGPLPLARPPVPPKQWLEEHPEPTQFIRTQPPQHRTEPVDQPPPVKDPWQEDAITRWREEQTRRARREDRP